MAVRRSGRGRPMKPLKMPASTTLFWRAPDDTPEAYVLVHIAVTAGQPGSTERDLARTVEVGFWDAYLRRWVHWDDSPIEEQVDGWSPLAEPAHPSTFETPVKTRPDTSGQQDAAELRRLRAQHELTPDEVMQWADVERALGDRSTLGVDAFQAAGITVSELRLATGQSLDKPSGSPVPVLPTQFPHPDDDARLIDLTTLCRLEPAWAANRIRHLHHQVLALMAKAEPHGQSSDDLASPDTRSTGHNIQSQTPRRLRAVGSLTAAQLTARLDSIGGQLGSLLEDLDAARMDVEDMLLPHTGPTPGSPGVERHLQAVSGDALQECGQGDGGASADHCELIAGHRGEHWCSDPRGTWPRRETDTCAPEGGVSNGD